MSEIAHNIFAKESLELKDLGLYRVEFKAMASACEIVIASTSQDEAMRSIGTAISEVHRVEQKYTRYQSSSVVSKINAAAGLEWVECDDETLSLFNYADTLFQSSDGLFDITSGVLRRAWNFQKPVIPSKAQLTLLKNLVGWNQVDRKDKLVKLSKINMEIDFGGFGKEYAADRAAAILSSHEIKHGFVNLGGDLRVIGPKPNGQPWMLGIPNPRDTNKLIASIPVATGGFATSGDYEKFFEINNRRYCHIISPLTGEPISFWQSVSVVAPLSITAGSCTTIAMLKEDEGLAWLEDLDMTYMAIDHIGNIYRKTKD